MEETTKYTKYTKRIFNHGIHGTHGRRFRKLGRCPRPQAPENRLPFAQREVTASKCLPRIPWFHPHLPLVSCISCISWFQLPTINYQLSTIRLHFAAGYRIIRGVLEGTGRMRVKLAAMALAALAVGGAIGDTSDARGLVTLISVNLSP